MKRVGALLCASLFAIACGNESVVVPVDEIPAHRIDAESPQSQAPQSGNQAERGSVDEYPAQNETQTKKDAPQTETKPNLPDSQFPLAPLDLTNQTPTELWATYYYLPEVNTTPNGIPLLDMKGKELGPQLSQRDWCNAAMEGSVHVLNAKGGGTTYNYAGSTGSSQTDCSPFFDFDVSQTRFQVAKGAFGDGVRNYRLIPFRTIAVDPNVIPYGTVLYIPAARGVKITLPDGTKALHDGYFFAGDTGGLIKENHIDVFIGVAKSNPFDWIGSNAAETFDAYRVDQTEAAKLMVKLHLGTK